MKFKKYALEDWLLAWASAWAMLAEAIVAVLSLGLFWPYWHMDYLVWKVRRQMARRGLTRPVQF